MSYQHSHRITISYKNYNVAKWTQSFHKNTLYLENKKSHQVDIYFNSFIPEKQFFFHKYYEKKKKYKNGYKNEVEWGWQYQVASDSMNEFKLYSDSYCFSSHNSPRSSKMELRL